MKLDELVSSVAVDGEVCDSEFEGDTADVEQDLQEALEFLDKILVMMEDIQVQGGKIKKIPRGMTKLMEDASEFLSQWEPQRGDDDKSEMGDAFRLCPKCMNWKHTGKCPTDKKGE